MPVPIVRKPETDKISRTMGVCTMIEGGRLYLLTTNIPAVPQSEQLTHWWAFTPPRSAQIWHSSGLLCHRPAQFEPFGNRHTMRQIKFLGGQICKARQQVKAEQLERALYEMRSGAKWGRWL